MRMTMRRITRCWLAAAGCLLSLAVAAQTYPTRPVTLIVPFSPGGGTDVAARLFAKELGARLGQSAGVDNRAGAAGNLGSGVLKMLDMAESGGLVALRESALYAENVNGQLLLRHVAHGPTPEAGGRCAAGRG
jgi:tripartite-type tricarboxylate transporter receptor subunit TctC